MSVSITLSIIKDGDYWCTLFEIVDEVGYFVAKATISQNEPSNEKVEKFLLSLNRYKLQFVKSEEMPVKTQKVFVAKKLKYEKDKFVEVLLKNPYGAAKNLLHQQKKQNNLLKKEIENQKKRELEMHKREVKDEKQKRR